MQIIDANIILRYLLKDNKKLYEQSKNIIEEESIFIPNEITAEVVYVLEKVYEIPREKIKESLEELYSYENLTLLNKEVLLKSLDYYTKNKLDYVDTLLCGYKEIEGYEIASFDKKLVKTLKGIENQAAQE